MERQEESKTDKRGKKASVARLEKAKMPRIEGNKICRLVRAENARKRKEARCVKQERKKQC